MTQDRNRTVMIKGKQVNFVFLGSEAKIPFDKVTSVSVIPFTKAGDVVAVRNPRGIDIPGGHVQQGETSIEQVAHREVGEEAYAKMDSVEVVDIIQSDYYGAAPDQLTYMVIMMGEVSELMPFEVNDETTERQVMPTQDFITAYSGGDRGDMEALLKAALEKRAMGMGGR